MTPKQKRFCEIYAGCGNAARAAREAGFSERTARQTGSKLLAKPDIENYVNQLREELRSEQIASSEEALKTISAILRDTFARNSDRIRAAELLLKVGGVAAISPDRQETAAEEEPETFVVASFPHILGSQEEITALMLPDGTVVPLAGHEQDDTLVYVRTEEPCE